MKWVVAILLLLLSFPVLGATIKGSVYDFGLDKVADAVVKINTVPAQTIVAKDGNYAFEVPDGTYTLTASVREELSVEENIVASDDGEFVVDLILFPMIDTEQELLDEEIPDIAEVEEEFETKTNWPLWIGLSLAFIVIIVFLARRKAVVIERVKEVAIVDDLQKILKFIEDEGGRTTQKDIRKILPYSEAKVSLMIDELEEKGLVKKIKKGRGNIIIKT